MAKDVYLNDLLQIDESEDYYVRLVTNGERKYIQIH